MYTKIQIHEEIILKKVAYILEKTPNLNGNYSILVLGRPYVSCITEIKMNLLVKIVFSFIQINIKGTVPDSSKHTITMYTFGAN